LVCAKRGGLWKKKKRVGKEGVEVGEKSHNALFIGMEKFREKEIGTGGEGAMQGEERANRDIGGGPWGLEESEHRKKKEEGTELKKMNLI